MKNGSWRSSKYHEYPVYPVYLASLEYEKALRVTLECRIDAAPPAAYYVFDFFHPQTLLFQPLHLSVFKDNRPLGSTIYRNHMGILPTPNSFRPPIHILDFGKMSNPSFYSDPPTIRDSRVGLELKMVDRVHTVS